MPVVEAYVPGSVIMFADMSLLAGLAAPVTPVSCKSHRVRRVAASASAAEAIGLSEAIAQGDWVCALWSEMVLGLSLPEWRERKEVPPLISVPVRTGEVLLIWKLFGKTCQTTDVLGKAQVADALTKLHGGGDLLRTVCRQEDPEIMAARRQERRERERVLRVKSPLKLREPVDETTIPVTPMPTVT